MKKLFIHIGTHKTGSTSIQNFCDSNSAALAKESINFIPTSSISKIYQESKNLTQASTRLHKVLSVKLKSPYDKVFLSWENFSGGLYNFYSDSIIYFKSLKDAIPPGFNAELIVFFRRQDEFIQSAFNQAKHEGKFAESEDLLSIEYRPNFDWLNYLQTLKKIFTNDKIHVLPYDKKVFQESSILNLIGKIIDSNTLTSQSKKIYSNVGMSPDAIRLYEAVCIKSGNNETMRKTLRKVLQKVGNKGVLNEYTYLDIDQKKKLLNYYRESNKRLAELYWRDTFELEEFTPPTGLAENEKPDANLELEVILNLLKMYHELQERYRNNFLIRAINKFYCLYRKK